MRKNAGAPNKNLYVKFIRRKLYFYHIYVFHYAKRFFYDYLLQGDFIK